VIIADKSDFLACFAFIFFLLKVFLFVHVFDFFTNQIPCDCLK